MGVHLCFLSCMPLTLHLAPERNLSWPCTLLHIARCDYVEGLALTLFYATVVFFLFLLINFWLPSYGVNGNITGYFDFKQSLQSF